jgi:hypothetical protein
LYFASYIYVTLQKSKNVSLESEGSLVDAPVKHTPAQSNRNDGSQITRVLANILRH